jgi:large subunit ribosomal protein L22e
VKSAGGVKGKLGESVKISRSEGIVTVEVENDATAKRQLKYLTRRYLKKQTLSNYLRVIAPKKDTYMIKYLASTGDAEEEGEDVE